MCPSLPLLFLRQRDEKGAEASCFLAFVWCRRAEIDDASTKIPLFLYFQHLHLHHLRSLIDTVIPACAPDMLQSTSTCSEQTETLLGFVHCLGTNHEQPAWFQQLPSYWRIQYLSRPSRSHEHLGCEMIVSKCLREAGASHLLPQPPSRIVGAWLADHYLASHWAQHQCKQRLRYEDHICGM